MSMKRVEFFQSDVTWYKALKTDTGFDVQLLESDERIKITTQNNNIEHTLELKNVQGDDEGIYVIKGLFSQILPIAFFGLRSGRQGQPRIKMFGLIYENEKVKTDATNKSLVYSCDLTVTNKTQKPKGIMKVFSTLNIGTIFNYYFISPVDHNSSVL